MLRVQDYADVLATVQRINKFAHIAGGAVRDTILEKPIKDIDLFLSESAADEAAQALRAEHGYVKVGEWKQYLGFSDPAIVRLAKFERADATIPVCLIGLSTNIHTIRDNIRRFDFGLCMVAWSGQDIVYSPQFHHDAEHRTFTLHRADNKEQYAYSMSRFKKITQDRYAGYGLSVPLVFRGFAAEKTFQDNWYVDETIGFDGEQTLRPKQR
jgi:hypothetical protein